MSNKTPSNTIPGETFVRSLVVIGFVFVIFGHTSVGLGVIFGAFLCGLITIIADVVRLARLRKHVCGRDCEMRPEYDFTNAKPRHPNPEEPSLLALDTDERIKKRAELRKKWKGGDSHSKI